jgi:hypothetical protein
MSDNLTNTEKALATVDSKIIAVESAIAELDALNDRKAAISKSIGDATAAEKSALSSNDDDALVVQKLVTARALADVHGSRLTDVTAKIARQEAVVIEAGRVARQYAAEIAQLLAQDRHAHAFKAIEETFQGQPVDAKHLATFNKTVLLAEALAASFGAYPDAINEIPSLRQLRGHFEPVIEAVAADSFQIELPAVSSQAPTPAYLGTFTHLS